MRVPISFFIRWTHSNTLVVRSLSRSVSHAHAVSRSLLSLMLGSRCGSPAWLTLSLLTLSLLTLAHALPPTRPPGLTVRSVSSLTCGGSPRLALSCSHRATRALSSRPHARFPCSYLSYLSYLSRSAHARLTPSRPPALTVRSVSSQISHMRRISVLLSHALIARLAPSRGFPCSCALRCTLSLSCSLLLPALKSNPAREPARDRPEVQQYAFYSPQRLHTRAEI